MEKKYKYTVLGEGTIRKRGKVVRGRKTWTHSMGKIYSGNFSTKNKAMFKVSSLARNPKIKHISVKKLDLSSAEYHRSGFKSGRELVEYKKKEIYSWDRA